jgi:hypothetical protein
MKKKILKVLFVVSFSLVLLRCSPISSTEQYALPGESEIAGIRAIYLVRGNGQLAEYDLDVHPEVLVVHTFMELQDFAEIYAVDLWIDKDAVELVDSDWLHQEPQKYYPLVLVGYNEPLYAFGDILNGFGIEGPLISWDTKSLEPGFSVWILQDEGEFSSSSFMNGYKEEATVQSVLNITNVHLKIPVWTTY